MSEFPNPSSRLSPAATYECLLLSAGSSMHAIRRLFQRAARLSICVCHILGSSPHLFLGTVES